MPNRILSNEGVGMMQGYILRNQLRNNTFWHGIFVTIDRLEITLVVKLNLRCILEIDIVLVVESLSLTFHISNIREVEILGNDCLR